MSFHSWLQKLRSALAPGRGEGHQRRQGSLRAAKHRSRPCLELLEDRTSPSVWDTVSLTVTNLLDDASTGGAGAGKIKFNEFTIKKTTDRASPAFL